ncbi:MAG: Fic family protein [Clostridia bacterium]|nr:Fic family protein [Clostridia bacterium]
MPKMEEQQKYIDIIGEIDKCYALMKEVRPLSASELRYFTSEFSISASHNSNAIEGNTFTFDETKLLIEKGIVTGAHSLRESEDIVGYKQAFDFLYESVKDNKPITQEFIKQVHGFVLRGDEEAGKYREIQNYVGSLSRIIYTPCSPSQVKECMAKYVDELQAEGNSISYFVKQSEIDWVNLFHTLARHHIEFEKIHPFVDGNGRTGRLLMIYEMISAGLLPVDIRYEEQKRYYAALAAYDDKIKYSTRPKSSTEGMAKLLAESELASMKLWLSIYNKI